ncbi:MAG: two-component system NtrC family sensor kinase [Cyclobacteriaceae bacterium]|jgi:two-component system NtrC family sensor kinase
MHVLDKKENKKMGWRYAEDFFIRFLILIILAFGCQQVVHGQDQKMADSLTQELNQLLPEDTSRLRLLKLITQNHTDPKLRLRYADQLMDEARAIQDISYLHHAYMNQGQAYRLLGDFDVAIYALFKAKNYAERVKYRQGLAAANTALADVYSVVGNHPIAIVYYQQSLEELGDSDSTLLATTLLNMGDEYYLSKMYDSALVCFEQSKMIYELIGNDPSGLAYNLGNIGLVQAELGQLALAEANVSASIRQLEKLEDHYAIAIFLSYMAHIYQKQGQLEEAQFFADSSMSIATKYGFKTEARDNSLRLADIYAMNANYEEAFRYHQQYVNLKDSITNEEVYGRIENLESAFELSKKQAEVELLKERERNSEIIITTGIIIGTILLILAAVILGYYRSKARVNEILEKQKLSLESVNRTKDKYFSIISHDMRGPILAFHGISRLIKMMAKRGATDELISLADDIDDSVHNLSGMLDGLLNWSLQQQGQIPYHPEYVSVKLLIDELIDIFVNMASAKNIIFIHKIDNNLKMFVDINTIRTVLRNIVNNAIKFTQENGEVLISAVQRGDFLEVKITDTGTGMPAEKLSQLFKFQQKSEYGTAGEKGLGLGLQLVFEFTEMNKGNIKVESVIDQGTTFILQFPMKRGDKPNEKKR